MFLRMMLFYTVAVLIVFVSSQTVDPSILRQIFNTPLPGYSDTIVIRLKEGITTYVDEEGRKYSCVPQYPYDPNISASEMSDAGVTGCGIIQVRSEDEDECHILVDSVCTLIMEPGVTPRPNEVNEPKPSPNKTNEPKPPPTGTNEPRPRPSETNEPRPLPSETTAPRPPPTNINEPRPPPNEINEPRPPPTNINEPKPPPSETNEPKLPPTNNNEPRPPSSETNEPRPPLPKINEPRPPPSETNEFRPPPIETNEPRPPPTNINEPRPPSNEFNEPKPPPSQPKPPPSEIKGCGYRNLRGLANNTKTQPGEFPWVVALLDFTRHRYVGVGALISPEVVVTTAHVVYRRNKKTRASIKYPNWLKIRAGEWDLRNSNGANGSQERNVKEVFILNEFNRTNPRHNIALLLLEKPLVMSEHINAICLPEQDEVFDRYKSCVATGWDKDVADLKSNNSNILKKVELDIVPYTRCSTLLKRTRLGYNFKLHSSFICGGGKETRNTCQGDGGAPLACPVGDNRYKLTGLVSWGIGCGQTDTPALYTNVPKYRQWVDRKMEAWGLQTSWYVKEDDDYYDYQY